MGTRVHDFEHRWVAPCRYAFTVSHQKLDLTLVLFCAAATPFANIVLLSFNSSTAIIVQIFIALLFLNEVFICKFDLPALFLIILGSSLIVLTANFTDTTLSVQELKESLTQLKSIIYLAFVFCLLNCTFWVVKSLRRHLARFELNVEKWLLVRKNAAAEADI